MRHSPIALKMGWMLLLLLVPEAKKLGKVYGDDNDVGEQGYV